MKVSKLIKMLKELDGDVQIFMSPEDDGAAPFDLGEEPDLFEPDYHHSKNENGAPFIVLSHGKKVKQPKSKPVYSKPRNQSCPKCGQTFACLCDPKYGC